VKIAHPDALASPTASLHPTSLYLATSNLVIFCILLYFKDRRQFGGQIFWVYVLLYGILRFLIEALLGNQAEPATIALSVRHVASLSVAITALAMLVYLNRNAKRRSAVPLIGESD
jgi:phosphatidylglycerol:prolipoprotein diacylglycerol transferase